MKVIDKIQMDDVSECKVTFIRINPEDKKETIKKILEQLSDISWIEKIMPEELKISMKAKVEPTVELLNKQLNENNDGIIT